MLYQAKLYPELKANALTEAEIQRLHEALQQVPEAAVEAEADSEKFPPDWLFHVRWDGKKKNPKINGNAVEFLKVGGRVRHAKWVTEQAVQCCQHPTALLAVELCVCISGPSYKGLYRTTRGHALCTCLQLAPWATLF